MGRRYLFLNSHFEFWIRRKDPYFLSMMLSHWISTNEQWYPWALFLVRARKPGVHHFKEGLLPFRLFSTSTITICKTVIIMPVFLKHFWRLTGGKELFVYYESLCGYRLPLLATWETEHYLFCATLRLKSLSLEVIWALLSIILPGGFHSYGLLWGSYA